MHNEITKQPDELLDPIFQEVDATIERLARKRFAADPLVGERYSRITSIVSSAYKRHGAIIEHALLAALKSAPHLQVWPDPLFRVSPEADMLAGSDASTLGTSLRYGAKNFARTLQVDVLVYNRDTGLLGAYECKRGFGYHDSGKKRSMLRDLRCQQMLLQSYGEGRGGKRGRSGGPHHILLWAMLRWFPVGADTCRPGCALWGGDRGANRAGEHLLRRQAE